MIPLLLVALAIAIVAFGITWAISVRMKNYGLLDAAWSYGVAVLAPIYTIAGPGYSGRKWLAAGVGVAWSLRLGTYILRRVLRHHPTEDVRYETLRRRWPGPGMFLLFFELQALVVVIFSLPFLFIAFDTAKFWTLTFQIGISLAIISVSCEVLADRQMAAFKANPENRGKVCEAGLWRYSRHPNYFFEFLVWVGFALAAWSSPFGWIAVACPLLMLYFLLEVTGIPLTEEYAIKSKGDAYRAYQRTTSAFIPWFRKTPAP